MTNLSPEQLQLRHQQIEENARMVRVAAARRSVAGPQRTARIRVNEWGAGVIATGETDPDTFDNLYHEEGDVIEVPLETAEAHVARRMASIVREPEAALEGADALVVPAPERRGPGRPPKAA